MRCNYKWRYIELCIFRSEDSEIQITLPQLIKYVRDYTAVSRHCYNAGVLDDKFESHRSTAVIVRNGRSQNIIDKRGPRRPSGSLATGYRPPLSAILPVHLPSCGATASEKLKLSVLKSLHRRRNMSKQRYGKRISRARANYKQFKQLFFHYVRCRAFP